MATILIVDDHLPHRLLFTTVLAKEGHRLIEANDGPEGLEKIRSEHPDLAIVDIPMPSMDGFQFVQKLREDPETAGLPVIFYSDSYNHREIEELAQHCGVTRVLRKDCDAKVILQNMRAVLEDSNRGTPAARDIWVMSIEEFQRSRQQLLSDKLLQREGQLEEASRQLQQLARQHELILNTIEQGIIGLDTSGQIGFANAAAARILGYATRELLGQPLREAIHPARADGSPHSVESCPLLAAVREGRGIYRCDDQFCRKDGTLFPVEYSLRPLTEEGQLLGAVLTFQDITERRRAEQRLQEQATLLDQATDFIFVLDLNGQVRFWNKSAEKCLGWSAAEILGQNAFEILSGPHNQAELEKARREVLNQGEWTGEMKQSNRSGKELILHSHWTLVRKETGQPESILVISTDITEKKKLEAQYFRAQRLESLGILAGGIAHDLNNVLTPITMAVELLRMKTRDPDSQVLLQTMLTSTQRGAEMVKQILSFARGGEGERLQILLKHVIKDTCAMLRHSLPKNITINIEVPEELWLVSANATQIGQVLMNLCVNSCDAMPGGGQLTMTAKNVVLQTSCSTLHPEARPGPHVVLTVRDTGTGIPPEILDKIFDPFFTTKDHGKGTGLGLATVQGIVKSHGGFVTVSSTVGQGTEFKVYLPAVPPQAATPPQETAHAPPLGARELILVVDDEASIREIARETLESWNYRVLTASNGTEAMTLFMKHWGELRAVLTDLAMPGMDGPALIQALKQLNPGLPILVATGLLERGKSTELRLGRVQGVLIKPYSAEMLLNTLAEILGK